jgi:hypothetical protein
MHKQRTVRRGYNVRRYTAQKPIKRGGPAVPPAPPIETPVLEGVDPMLVPPNALATFTLLGANFDPGCSGSTGALPEYNWTTRWLSEEMIEMDMPVPDVPGGSIEVLVKNAPNAPTQAEQKWSNVIMVAIDVATP